MKTKKDSDKIVENHKTAAWSDIKNTDSQSNVAHPSVAQTKRAKDYVDENEK